MPYPTIFDFVVSVTSPREYSKRLGDMQCCRNIYGEPHMIVGGNSVIFKVVYEGGHYALKCHTKTNPRIACICEYLSHTRENIAVVPRYFNEEIYIPSVAGGGCWYDVSLSEWSDAFTLGFEVRKALLKDDRNKLKSLAAGFDSLAIRLLGREWAHGDLKPENIIVGAGDTMKLIDLDAAYIPGFNGENAIETGTPFYQHPLRSVADYNGRIDEYPAAFISASLHSLAHRSELARSYGDRDIFFLNPVGIRSGSCEAHKAALAVAAENGDPQTYTLLCELAGHSPYIERIREIMTSRDTVCLGEPVETERRGSRWGFVGNDGRFVIEPLFCSAMEFNDGLALVTLGDKYHYIDVSGRVAINGSGFISAKSFRNGFAEVVLTDGSTAVIDTYGNPGGPKP